MLANKRTLRSMTKSVEVVDLTSDTTPSSPVSSSNPEIRIFAPGPKLPGLTISELNLLRRKQKQLKANAQYTVDSLPQRSGPHLRNALEATLIFAQYEAGSAVCIDPAGWVLTCAHCFGDNEEEYLVTDKTKWLLSYDGLAVQAECREWDPKCDLALLKIIALEKDAPDTPVQFCYLPLSNVPPKLNTPILCIGQPGRDDLESATAQQTKYNLVEVSEGLFRGMIENADPLDNSEIGTLKHDAWTYWGHSGAPLVRKQDGTLLGLHSSWDDQTTMRHGVPLAAIKHFLKRQASLDIVTG